MALVTGDIKYFFCLFTKWRFGRFIIFQKFWRLRIFGKLVGIERFGIFERFGRYGKFGRFGRFFEIWEI